MVHVFHLACGGVFTYQGVLRFGPGLGSGRTGMRQDPDRAVMAMALGVLATVLLLVVGFAAATTMCMLILLPIGLAASVYFDSRA